VAEKYNVIVMLPEDSLIQHLMQNFIFSFWQKSKVFELLISVEVLWANMNSLLISI